MSDESPLVRYFKWFDAQPLEVRADVALCIMRLVEGNRLRMVIDGDLRAEVAFLRRELVNLATSFTPTASALMLCCYTDHAFLRRAHSDEWTGRRQTRHLETARKEGRKSQIPYFENELERLPFRRKLWTKAEVACKHVRKGALSPLSIDGGSDRASPPKA